MNNKGQMAATEAVIIIILILACGLLGWLWATKKTESNVYQKDSNPTVTDVHRTDWPLSIHIGEGGCARIPKVAK
jgi:hypothetical protein